VRHLVLVIVLALASIPQTGPLRAEQRPNVVLLIIDDARWDSIGAAGNKIVYTPRLDRLAKEGVRFRQARVTTSICMVSRASLLTGQYMSRHGITAFGRALAPEAFANTYPAVLRRAGYWVGHVGKYDVGQPRQSDYDFHRAYHGVHWIESGGERLHVTEKNARDSLEFLRSRPKDRPFELTVGFFASHAQDNAKEQYLPQDWSAEFYRGKRIPPPIHGDPRYQAALPPFLTTDANEGRVRYHWRFDTPESYQAYMTRYYRLITEVDGAVGRIVDELKAQGVYENTLIVFIGDNGYFHGDRGLADKWYPYEESIRVPLVVRDPRLPAARRDRTLDQFALNIDVAPTIVSAAGVPVPSAMQGQDVSPLYLHSRPPAWRDEFFYEHPTVTSKDRIPSSQAVVRRDWKYVEWPEFDYQQLFDLKDDPGELRNLAADAAHAAQRSRMHEALTAWRERAR
jgi:arylsulfatase A-like enzyme